MRNLVCYPAGSSPFAPNTATKNPPFGGFYKTLVRAKYFAALTHGSPRNPAGSSPFAPNTATKNPPFGGFYKTLVRAKYFAALTHGSPRNPAGSSPFAPNTATKNPPFGGFYKTLVRAKGLEPSTSTLARLRSSQLSYARTVWDILTYLFYLCKQFFI